MEVGNFYFINNAYFEKFKGNNLMINKEIIDGKPHNRPCYYSFKDNNSEIYWMIPISSQIKKYEDLYADKIIKYPDFDGIRFGYVLGEKRAFLVQNLCPVTTKYIENVYIDKAKQVPVEINPDFKKELNARARKAIRLYRNGVKIVFPKILDIEKKLTEELRQDSRKAIVATVDKRLHINNTESTGTEI